MSKLSIFLKFSPKDQNFRRVLFPVAFLAIEFLIAVILNWQLFGEKYEYNDERGQAGIMVHNPLIVINAVHSDRLTHPYGSLTGETPVIKFYSPRTVLKALCFLSSLVFALIGVFVAVLWLKYASGKGMRYANTRWWLWPMACMGGHIMFYLLANATTVSNIFLKQF